MKKDSKEFEKFILEKLKEAEEELNSSTKRYSKEEILESVNKILKMTINIHYSHFFLDF